MNEKEMPTIGRHNFYGCNGVEIIARQRYSKCGDCASIAPPDKSQIKNASRVKETLSTEKQATQMQRVYDCFAERPRTMLDVSIATGILRANICRYVAKWRKAGMIQVHHFAKDIHTRMMCAYLTTDTALFSQPMFNQLNLFD